MDIYLPHDEDFELVRMTKTEKETKEEEEKRKCLFLTVRAAERRSRRIEILNNGRVAHLDFLSILFSELEKGKALTSSSSSQLATKPSSLLLLISFFLRKKDVFHEKKRKEEEQEERKATKKTLGLVSFSPSLQAAFS